MPQQPEPAYVAPAAEVLTVLHRPGPDGRTRCCGRDMTVESELWMPVDQRDGDQICAAAEDLQEATLW